MNKKFKVRIVHFSNEYYTIEYSYSSFLNNWKPLLCWFDNGSGGSIHNMSEKLFTFKKAEETANLLKTIEDVNNYHLPEIAKEKAFRKARKKWKKENIPYKTKSII